MPRRRNRSFRALQQMFTEDCSKETKDATSACLSCKSVLLALQQLLTYSSSLQTPVCTGRMSVTASLSSSECFWWERQRCHELCGCAGRRRRQVSLFWSHCDRHDKKVAQSSDLWGRWATIFPDRHNSRPGALIPAGLGHYYVRDKLLLWRQHTATTVHVCAPQLHFKALGCILNSIATDDESQYTCKWARKLGSTGEMTFSPHHNMQFLW